MDIQLAVLCDYASDYDGKLCVLGCFDTVEAKSLPASREDFTFAFRFTVMPDEGGFHEFSVSIIDPDGKPVNGEEHPYTLDVDIHIPDDLEFLTRNYVLNCYGVRFDHEGIYSVDLTIDGKFAARVPFNVVITG